MSQVRKYLVVPPVSVNAIQWDGSDESLINIKEFIKSEYDVLIAGSSLKLCRLVDATEYMMLEFSSWLVSAVEGIFVVMPDKYFRMNWKLDEVHSEAAASPAV
jgi:hypothetical protein